MELINWVLVVYIYSYGTAAAMTTIHTFGNFRDCEIAGKKFVEQTPTIGLVSIPLGRYACVPVLVKP